MQLAYAMLADAAQIGTDGKISMIGGDIDRINAAQFPAQAANLAVVLRLNVEQEECNREHQLQLTLKGPLSQSLASIQSPFTPQVPLNHIRGPVRSLFVLTLVGLTFEQPGTYYLQISVDGKQLERIALHVVKTAVAG